MHRAELLRKTVLICLTFVLLSPLMASAQRVASMYGLGNDSCGAFVEALSRHPSTAGLDWEGDHWLALSASYVEWLLGFITAFNMTNSQGRNLNGADRAGVALWANNWCREHPMQQLRDAAWALIKEQGGYDPKLDQDRRR
jgi:hypothetical protein